MSLHEHVALAFRECVELREENAKLTEEVEHLRAALVHIRLDVAGWDMLCAEQALASIDERALAALLKFIPAELVQSVETKGEKT